MNNSPAQVHLSNLTKKFGEVTAVDQATLTLPSGQTLALLGPSGCGKTTLLRMIAGLETPDEGTITIGGVMVDGAGRRVPAEDRNVGMVFHNGALFPHMTVGENVAYGLGRRPDSRRVERALDMVDLAGFAQRRPATLSAGQTQRVALARALAPEPQVLLLDEPLASLDAELRLRIRSELATLLRELHITAIFVTHDQEEAFVVGSHVAVMKQGRILQSGTPGDVYNQPVDPWVARFVGDANLLAGVANGVTARTWIGDIPLADPSHGPCDVVVRPEYIEVFPGTSSTVETVEFYGHDTAYSLVLNGYRITARVLAAPRFSIGDQVNLAYAGPAAPVFPASEPTS